MPIRNVQSVADTTGLTALPAGNPNAPPIAFQRDTNLLKVYDPDAAAFLTFVDKDTVRQAAVQHLIVSVATADVNAGLTLLAAATGYKYQMVDCILIAIGGNAATATSVDILGTQATASVKLVSAAVAGIARSVVARAGGSNIAVLADGASFAPCDSGTAITILKNGSDLATATAILVMLDYVVIPG